VRRAVPWLTEPFDEGWSEPADRGRAWATQAPARLSQKSQIKADKVSNSSSFRCRAQAAFDPGGNGLAVDLRQADGSAPPVNFSPKEAQMPYAFTLTTTVPASAQEIYEAWLDSLAHSEMTGGEAVMSDEVGAEVAAWDGYISGRNLELVPGQRIVQSWRTTEFDDEHEDSILTVTLEEVEDGTLLTLVHSRVPDGQTSYEEGGWQEHYFEPMKAYFAERQQAGPISKAKAAAPKKKAKAKAKAKVETKSKTKRAASRAKPKPTKSKAKPAAGSKKKSKRAAAKARPKRAKKAKRKTAKSRSKR
jgi:uncharacterized protein YndB with AHSA1/START domain